MLICGIAEAARIPKRSVKIHPELYSRMVAAGLTPNYPRLKAAKGPCWTSYLVFATLVFNVALNNSFAL
jgi:hypothetical protein